ncbi:MAG: hypothetical protein EOQ65_21445 [Mesorhizobium sp.]|uniref:hypothetical protein n=1 Tax=Mesorhizobium sp. TaxID=1871066 RepID=UPI000FEA93D1|nr:hypothetical protein [Mesorhizobium sp.]RWG57947.1 MAG: hypothetical protein EOQ65_21445 [Mesorhizobium sp.]
MPSERDEWLFETAEEGILEELCENGYFGGGRPEDRLAYELDFRSKEDLTEEERALYDAKILPVLRAGFYDPDSLDLVYDSLRRLPWPDPTAQADLFQAAR